MALFINLLKKYLSTNRFKLKPHCRVMSFGWFLLGSASGLLVSSLLKKLYRVYPYFMKPSVGLHRLSCSPTADSRNRCALIIGATDGVGKQFTQRFHSMGWNVIAIGRSDTKLASLKQGLLEIRNEGKIPDSKAKSPSPSITTFQIDFAKQGLTSEKVSSMLQSLEEHIKTEVEGQFLMVNCCGMAHVSDLLFETSLEDIETVSKVNINSLIMMKCVLSRYLSLQKAHQNEHRFQSNALYFINISSAVAVYPNKYSAIYSASKAFCSNLMQVLEQESKSLSIHPFNGSPEAVPHFFFLNLTPFYIKTKMVNYVQAVDVAQASQIVDGALRLLGRKTQAMGCLRHQLVSMSLLFFKRVFKQRVQKARLYSMKMKEIAKRRAKKQISNSSSFQNK